MPQRSSCPAPCFQKGQTQRSSDSCEFKLCLQCTGGRLSLDADSETSCYNNYCQPLLSTFTVWSGVLCSMTDIISCKHHHASGKDIHCYHYYRWGKQGLERISILLKVTRLVSGQAESENSIFETNHLSASLWNSEMEVWSPVIPLVETLFFLHLFFLFNASHPIIPETWLVFVCLLCPENSTFYLV